MHTGHLHDSHPVDSQQRRPARGRRGPDRWYAPCGAFTLVEVLLVVSLLALLMALAWPVLQNQVFAAELPESAARIRDMLFMTRSEAALEHRRHRIRFAPREQQPYIEVEPDPIERPGEWEPVTAAWAQEPMLLGDVQVNEVRLGRPAYLKPVSREDDTEELEEQAEEEEEILDELEDPTGESAPTDPDEEIDENRPLIVFEADGSTDWATLLISKVPLEETLEEEHSQLWVVLDGRTGLARVREKVTEEQLADEDFYVQREKLVPPDELDVENLSFQLGGDETAAAPAGEGGTGPDALGNLTGQAGGQDPGIAGGPARGGGRGRFGNQAPGGRRGGARGDPRGGPPGRRGVDGRGGGGGPIQRRGQGGAGPANPHGGGDGDTMGDGGDLSDLERKLRDSNLTEEERENIRRSFRKGG